jgi:hypothetical protein
MDLRPQIRVLMAELVLPSRMRPTTIRIALVHTPGPAALGRCQREMANSGSGTEATKLLRCASHRLDIRAESAAATRPGDRHPPSTRSRPLSPPTLQTWLLPDTRTAPRPRKSRRRARLTLRILGMGESFQSPAPIRPASAMAHCLAPLSSVIASLNHPVSASLFRRPWSIHRSSHHYTPTVFE